MSIVTKWGNDSKNSGATIRDSFKTIRHAVFNTSKAFEVVVYGGSYNELTLGRVAHRIRAVGRVIIESTDGLDSFLVDGTNYLDGFEIIGYSNPIQRPLTGQAGGYLKNCIIKKDGTVGTIVAEYYTGGICENSIFINYNVSLMAGSTRCTYIGELIKLGTEDRTWVPLNGQDPDYVTAGNYSLYDILYCDKLVIQKGYPVDYAVLKPNVKIDLYDGATLVVADAPLAEARAYSEIFNFGVSLANCVEIDEADLFNDFANGDYTLKPTSIAATMSQDNSHVGKYAVGYTRKATDADWENNINFTLVGDKFEASDSLQSEIACRFIFPENRILKTAIIDAVNDNELGVAFDTNSNIAELYNGIGEEVKIFVYALKNYNFSNVQEIICDNAGTLPVSQNECLYFQADDTISYITPIDPAGNVIINEISDISGRSKIDIKFWKKGEQEPREFQLAHINSQIFVDAQGRTDADAGFDPSTQQPAIGANVIIRAIVEPKYLRSI